MLICCPMCHFEREINESQIPAHSTKATCPNCGHKFTFRTLKQVSSLAQPEQESNKEEQSIQEHDQKKDQKSSDYDELPPGAVIYPIKKEKQTEYQEDSQPDSEATESTNKENKRRRTLDAIPWERVKRVGLLRAFYQTILHVLFNAPNFFRSLPGARAGLGRPLLFYLILGVFQTLVERLWVYLSIKAAVPSVSDPQMQEMLGTMVHSVSLPLIFILTPIILVLQIFFFSGMFFLMVRLVQPDRADFATIFRVVAYSAAPTVVCVVPILGPVASSLWFAVSCLIGCHYALDLPWQKTFLALGPLYAIAFAVGLQIARQLLGA